jgi:hypothetical protein
VEWFAVGALGVVFSTLVVLCLLALLVRHRVHVRHRVDPKVATAAPTSWLADPRTPARLHRRLAKVGRTAGAVAADHRLPAKRWRTVEQPPMVDLAERLRAQAVGIDHELTRVAMLSPAIRRPALAAIQRSVMELEHAAARLVGLSAEVLTPPVLATEQADLFDVAGQIERLEQAHRELLALDQGNGLTPRPGVGLPDAQLPTAELPTAEPPGLRRRG